MKDRLLKMWTAAAIAGASTAPGPAAGAASPYRPLHLIAELSGTGVLLQVVGVSPISCDVHYALEVIGGRGNRSVQSGTARLRPGSQVAPLRLVLGDAQERGWSARLTVRLCDGTSYEEVRKSVG